MSDVIATPALEWIDFGISYVTAMWRLEVAAAVAEPMLAFHRLNPRDFGRSPLLHVLALVGRADDVRAELDRGPLPPMVDHWHVTAEAAVRAVVAALLDDRALARDAIEQLRPAGGRMAVSGISVVSGPVDGYLALALAVLGEREEASALAERAKELATQWGMTTYLGWLTAERNRLGF